MASANLPLPPHYDPDRTGEVWRVPYQQRAQEAAQWAQLHAIEPAHADRFKISLLLVDVQNTFCIPDYELYVGGRSGTGAVDDNRRLGAFIYNNLSHITEICPTMDTHQAAQIFHSLFLIDADGNHPPPFTLVTAREIESGIWRFNSALADSLGIDADYGQRFLVHYAARLKEGGKYDLTVWPYHAMLGGIGHALVSTIEEAVFFHSIARLSQPDFQVKGRNPLTENYSVLRPEVTQDAVGNAIASKNKQLIDKLLEFDAVVIAGQAKSHCVAWTIEDLLQEINKVDKSLTRKVYLLEDCTSPVFIPDVIDYTDQADQAFQRFADAGMHIVRSTEPMINWKIRGRS